MTPKTRAKLVRRWKAFGEAYLAFYEGVDEADDHSTIGHVLNDTPDLIRIARTRASYLRALVDAGHLTDTDTCPSDDRLWEMHPVNTTPDGGDLYER